MVLLPPKIAGNHSIRSENVSSTKHDASGLQAGVLSPKNLELLWNVGIKAPTPEQAVSQRLCVFGVTFGVLASSSLAWL
jgi:hypothetical protein